MIKLDIAGIIISTLLLMACSKHTENESNVTYECKMIYGADDSLRSTSKTLKGYILFSWKNNLNSWNYSIVQNLNISAAHENVCAGNSITGEECLKKNLHYFAEGEGFYWIGNINIETLEGKNINLSYPPDYIVEDIQAFCDSLKITLILGD